MAVVQRVWRKSYKAILYQVTTRPSLTQAFGFGERVISKGQYWERRKQLGVLPFLFFFLALVAQLIRLGVITGKGFIVDSSLLYAWRTEDPGARWYIFAGKKTVFGYKVHTVLCAQSDLPVFARPRKPAMVLLRVAETHPRAVLDAIRS